MAMMDQLQKTLDYIYEWRYLGYAPPGQVPTLRNLGCKGLENERPWDGVVIVFYLVVIFSAVFLPVVVKTHPLLNIFSLWLGVMFWFFGKPLLSEDMERMRRNNEILREKNFRQSRLPEE